MIVDDNQPGEPAGVITGWQIRIARLTLNWTAQELADRCKLGVATISRAERADVPPISVKNLDAIQRQLEEAGIAFLSEGQHSLAGGPGIRFRRPGPRRS